MGEGADELADASTSTTRGASGQNRLYEPMTVSCSATGGAVIQFFTFSWNARNSGTVASGLSVTSLT